jgi:hypothetical protein
MFTRIKSGIRACVFVAAVLSIEELARYRVLIGRKGTLQFPFKGRVKGRTGGEAKPS